MLHSDSEINQTKFTATTYKRGLATLEEQFISYRNNEVLFSEEVAVLKREVACKDYEINVLKSEFEKVKKEKEGIEFKIEKFDKASKDLDQLLGSQITDKSKKGLGYSAVPPPHPLIYNRPKKLDLSYCGLDEFRDLEVKMLAWHMTENIDYLSDFKEFDRVYVTFGGGTHDGRIYGTQGELNVGTSEEISQDCIMMPIWKDALYFDSPSKDGDTGEPKSAADDQKLVEDGLDNYNTSCF
ncbi:hypothetical protein Tco_1447454, partial [Tanacetum coccineum]